MIALTADWEIHAGAICRHCGGNCCTDDTQPPVSGSCYEQLIAAGVSPDQFEYRGYRRLKLNGRACSLFVNGRCRYHAVKPETCRAGPFTFDITGDRIAIYLKKETVCPVVRLLKESPEVYRQQYEIAAEQIRHLVRDLTPGELETICRVDEPETEYVAAIPLPEPPCDDNRY